MLCTTEGNTLEVPTSETFVVERRSLAGGGARTEIEVPDGIVHVGTRNPEPTTSFGGRPIIKELFQCTRAGKFEIRFVSSRPWEKAKYTIITTIICY